MARIVGCKAPVALNMSLLLLLLFQGSRKINCGYFTGMVMGSFGCMQYKPREFTLTVTNELVVFYFFVFEQNLSNSPFNFFFIRILKN